ncbi:MAG TPA: NADH-quinone oxidoreductase subunit J [Conexivisphaerales archaeon]|nr:NADH-quinone oxidoreductase subunit J [Conexivisphaerales archaeon]
MDYLLAIAILAFTSLMALLALESKSLVYGAVSLSGFFLGLSLFFFELGLLYLGVFQLLVYVGAVSVLILFAVMVIGHTPRKPTVGRFGGLGFLGGLFIALAAVFAGLAMLFSFLDLAVDTILQSLIYIGPVVVLLAFAVLFRGEPRGRSSYRFEAFGVLGAFLIFGSFLGALSYLGSLSVFSGDVTFSMADVAQSLLGQYGLLMVVLGLLLASAAFGAVALAKKEKEEK